VGWEALSALRNRCPRTTTGVSQRWFSGHFDRFYVWDESGIMTGVTNADARLLCISDGVCVIVYIEFSSVGAGTVGGE
jgi:hypothetical protein